MCGSQSLCTYVRADLVSSQPRDLAHASCCLLKSPHVLTLSFFLLPNPSQPSDPPWRREPWVVKLRTGPPTESAVRLPSLLWCHGAKQRPYQLGAHGVARARASGKSTWFRARQDWVQVQTHTPHLEDLGQVMLHASVSPVYFWSCSDKQQVKRIPAGRR